MKIAIVYESLTGNTARAASQIGKAFTSRGAEVSVSPIDRVDLPALANADLVVVGGWVDGLFVFGQRPGRAHRLRTLPYIDGKRAAVFCTYAINPGRTLDKLTAIVAERGGDVFGGLALRRNAIDDGAIDFVDSVMDVVAA